VFLSASAALILSANRARGIAGAPPLRLWSKEKISPKEREQPSKNYKNQHKRRCCRNYDHLRKKDVPQRASRSEKILQNELTRVNSL